MTASPDSAEVVDLFSEDESLWAVEGVMSSGSLWAMGVVTLSGSSALTLLFSDFGDMVVMLMLEGLVLREDLWNLSRQHACCFKAGQLAPLRSVSVVVVVSLLLIFGVAINCGEELDLALLNAADVVCGDHERTPVVTRRRRVLC